MNRDDIIRMAREAGIDALTKVGAAELERFAALVVDSSQRAEAPPGYAVVPVEPTEAMHSAAVKTIQRCTGNADFPPAVWRAMLASAQGEKP